jgi:hypothetical protein
VEGLERLIDHAPMFPPASLDVEAAVMEDARARGSEHAWMLARFVCPASRLEELGAVRGWDHAPPISVVLDGGEWRGSPAPVEAVEMVGPPREDVGGVEAFCEVSPREEGWRDAMEQVAAAGAKAKLRCGGATVPTVEEVAAFFAAARDLELAFKATAGLHHPVRTEREHGFLNFLTAAELARDGGGEAELRAVLATTDPEALGTGSAAARELFVSIGSCSFSEPVDDLRALGLL